MKGKFLIRRLTRNLRDLDFVLCSVSHLLHKLSRSSNFFLPFFLKAGIIMASLARFVHLGYFTVSNVKKPDFFLLHEWLCNCYLLSKTWNSLGPICKRCWIRFLCGIRKIVKENKIKTSDKTGKFKVGSNLPWWNLSRNK